MTYALTRSLILGEIAQRLPQTTLAFALKLLGLSTSASTALVFRVGHVGGEIAVDTLLESVGTLMLLREHCGA